MIAIHFTSETFDEKRNALQPHIGQRVLITVKRRQNPIAGIMGVVTDSAVHCDKTSIGLALVERVEVQAGGDWMSTKGHGSGAMTDRIHVRCTQQEKQRIAKAAAKSGVSVSEYVRQLALKATA